MVHKSLKELKLVVFHIGGGDEDVGPTEALLKLKGVKLDLYIFEIIDETNYTEVKRFSNFPNVNARIVPFGIGEYENEIVNVNVNKHQLSSSILPPSRLTQNNNPAYPGILDWEENTLLNYRFKATLSSIDVLIADGKLPKPDFLSLDIQGYELRALIGAKETVLKDVLGIVLESEFSEIYEGQHLFPEQSIFLRKSGFRLFELFNPQKWYVGPVFGKGFLTVVESLYFKYLIEIDALDDLDKNGFEDIKNIPEEKILKLAIIAFAFGCYSYFFTLFSYLKNNNKEYFESLSLDGETLKFVKFHEKVFKHWNRLDLTHSSLTKNFEKKFKKDLEAITHLKFTGHSEFDLFYLSFKKLVYKKLPRLLKIRLKFR